MIQGIRLAVASTLAIAALPALAQKPQIQWNDEYNFDQVETFQWQNIDEAQMATANPFMHSLIKNLLAAELATSGLTEVTSNPDVYVTYYGSTETGIPAWISAEESLTRPGAAGRILPGAKIEIYDDAGRALPPGEVGEIYARATYVPEFTYQNQGAMRREIGRGDLVTVGDVGWLDKDGYLYLCDRKRDMVISGGVNIYPAEIEAALVPHPAVKDCAVFGIPDEEFGESLCAHIELQPGKTATAEEIRLFLAQHLARFKIPRTIVFAEALPREDSGKIFKRKLRAPYWEKAGRAI